MTTLSVAALNELSSSYVNLASQIVDENFVICEDELLRMRLALVGVANIPTRMINGRHIPVLVSSVSTGLVFLRTLCGESFHHFKSVLLAINLFLQKSLFLKNHMLYDWSLVVQLQHNEIMHALEGNIRVLADISADIMALSALLGAITARDPTHTGRERLPVILNILRLNAEYFEFTRNDPVERAVWPQVYDAACLLIGQYVTINGYTKALAAVRNRLMHAYNGNTHLQLNAALASRDSFIVGVPSFYDPFDLDREMPAHRPAYDVEWRTFMSGCSAFMSRLWNRLMHALNGNSKCIAEKIRLIDKKAYTFVVGSTDPAEKPFFTEAEAVAYVRHVAHHPMVKEIGPQRTVDLLMMRRGVRLHQAFSSAHYHYVKHTEVAVVPQQLLWQPLRPQLPPVEENPYEPDTPFSRAHDVYQSGEEPTRGVRNLWKKMGITTSNCVVEKQSGFVKGVVDSIKTGWTVEHTISPKIQQVFSDSIKTVQEVKSADLLTSATTYFCQLAGVNPIAQRVAGIVVRTIRDVILIWEGTLVGNLAAFTLLSEQRGTLYAGLVTAITTLMKQFTQWVSDDSFHKQGGSDFSVDLSSVVELLGSVLLSADRPLRAANTMYTFSRNIGNAAQFVATMFMEGIKKVYELFTSKKLLITEADRKAAALDLVYKNFCNGLENVDHDRLVELRKLRKAYQQHLTGYLEVESDDKKRMRAIWQSKVIETTLSTYGVEVEYVNTRQRPVFVVLKGATGTGKTTLCSLLVAAIGELEHWPGSASEWLAPMRLSDEGFGSRLPSDCKAVQIDEPFVFSDGAENAGEVLNALLLGGNQPYHNEGPGVTEKETYDRPVVSFLTINRTGDPRIVNPEALNRRINILAVVTAADGSDLYKTADPERLRSLVQFTVGNMSYNFWQFVGMICSEIRKYHVGATMFDALKVNVRSQAPTLVVPTEVPVHVTSIFKAAEEVKSRNGAVHARTQPVSDVVAEKRGFTTKFLDESPLFVGLDRRGLNAMVDSFGTCEIANIEDYIAFLDAHAPSKLPLFDRHAALFGPVKFSPTEKLYYCPEDECVFNSMSLDAPCLFHKVSTLRCRYNHATHGTLVVDEAAPSVWASLVDKGVYIGKRVIKIAEKVALGLAVVVSVAAGAAAVLAAVALAYLLQSRFQMAVEWLVSKMFGSEAPVKQSYTTSHAVQAKQLIKPPRFQADVQKQGDFVVAAHAGIPEALYHTVDRCVLPVTTVAGSLHVNVQLTMIVGRLGHTVKHAFATPDGRAAYMVLPSPYNKVYKVKPKDGYAEADDAYVQTAYDTNQDMTFVILPKGMNHFPDLRGRYMTEDDFNVSLLNVMALYWKASPTYKISEDYKTITSTPTKIALLSVSNGSFTEVTRITYSDGDKAIGLLFDDAVDAGPGSCGGPVLPLNPRFGGGGRVFGLAHTGHAPKQRRSLAYCICREDIDAFLLKHPEINKILFRDDTGLEQQVQQTNSFEKRGAMYRVDKPGFMPSGTGIMKSKVFGCLDNIIIGSTPMPHPFRIPARVRAIDEMMAKYPAFLPSIDPLICQDVIECSKATKDFMLEASRKGNWARSEPLSWFEAINGTSDGKVKPLNLKSSAGYSNLESPPGSGKMGFFEQIPDTEFHQIKPEFLEEFDRVYALLFWYFTIPLAFAKTTPKSELRPPLKAPRATSSQHVMILLACRRIFAPVQAMEAGGAPYNGTATGVDPTGPDGSNMYAILMRHVHKICGDAKAFDASQESTTSSFIDVPIIEGQLRVVYPDVPLEFIERWALVLCFVAMIAYEVVGHDVYFHIDGNISGTLRTMNKNNNTSGVCIRRSWQLYYRRVGGPEQSMWKAFNDNVAYVTCGDDMAACTKTTFNAYDCERGYGDLGIKFTSEDKTRVERPYDPEIRFVKRTPHSFFGQDRKSVV